MEIIPLPLGYLPGVEQHVIPALFLRQLSRLSIQPSAPRVSVFLCLVRPVMDPLAKFCLLIDEMKMLLLFSFQTVG